MCLCFSLLACPLPQVREVGCNAHWRSAPLSHAECLLKIMRRKGRVNPLLTAPWVTTKIFRMDWLHVADIGVTADFIGNFFHEVLHFFPGDSKKERCASIYKVLLAFYDDTGQDDRFDCLLPTFFDSESKPYKMRGGAGNIRAWCPLSGSWHRRCWTSMSQSMLQ